MDRTGIVLHYSNMDAIPTYALYGEQEISGDWLHWETIPSRARAHGYVIAPHRHEHFFQFLLLSAGRAELVLDDMRMVLTPPAVVALPTMSVHGYRFSPDVDGLVVTLMERDIAELGLGVPPAAVVDTLPEVGAALADLVTEAETPGALTDAAMRARLMLVLVALARAPTLEPLRDKDADPARQHAMAFRRLVDRQFRTTRRIGDYAAAMGIGPTHLGRVCRQVLGAAPLDVIERRVALEARRMLRFSSLSIQQIGAELGYDDPAYFSRFIRRMLGEPPGRFRSRSRD